MRTQSNFHISGLTFAIAISIFIASPSLYGQDSNYDPARTPWGDPDIRGHYLPGTWIPLEVPRLEPWGETDYSGHNSTFSRFFRPENEDAAPTRPGPQQGIMVIDPSDGKIPLQPWAAEKRDEIMDRQDELEFLDPRVKCLPASLPRAHLPVGYNTYQILQVPGAVIILYEWNHHSRYIPLNDSPHVSSDIKLGMGDSRGHWEGNTLVVDVTNFTDNTWPVGHGAPPEGAPASAINTGHGVFQSEALHVTERFTIVDKDTINYQATIADPNVYTRPWTIKYEGLKRAPDGHILFEYACHEGNARNLRLMTGAEF